MVRETDAGWKLELTDYELIKYALSDLDAEFVGSHGTFVEGHPEVEIDIGYSRTTDALIDIEDNVTDALRSEGMLIEETRVQPDSRDLLLVVTFEPGMYGDKQ